MSLEELIRQIAEMSDAPDEPDPVMDRFIESDPAHRCKRCHEAFVELNEDGLCQDCAATLARGYEISRMAGRLANGAEADGGYLYHARLLEADGYPAFKAVCGAQPGRRSIGWGAYKPSSRRVTCKRCLARLQRLGYEVK